MGKSTEPAATTTNVTQTNLPEYAKPYFENVMQRTQSWANKPYEAYKFQRSADLGMTPAEQQIQANTLAMSAPKQFADASGLASAAGQGSLRAADYGPAQFSAQQIGMPNLQQYRAQDPGMIAPGQYSAAQMGAAQTQFNPELQQFQMDRAREAIAGKYTAAQMNAAQTQFNPELQQFQMDRARDITAGNYTAPQMDAAQTQFQANLERFQMAGPERFGQAQASEYMSPYIRNVLDVQKREATTDARKAQLAQDLGAARQGTYGGARQVLAATERERALGQQMGDIEARGLQSAYESSQGQFERDRTAQMAAQQANLQAALGVQELGTKTGLDAALANLSSAQQTNVQNMAAQLQTQGLNADQAMRAALANQQADLSYGQANLQAAMGTQELGTQTGLQAALANMSSAQQSNVQNLAAQLQTQGLNAEQAMRAALANQQADLSYGQANLQAAMGTQQLGTQTGLQAALANLDAASQANVQNLTAQNQMTGMNADQALRAALANQQAQAGTSQQNLQAALTTQQLGVGSGLEAMRANQSSALEAQRLGELSRQFGAQNRLAGFGQAGQMAQTLGNLGQYQQQSDLQRLQAQTAAAGQTRTMEGQKLDQFYADYLRQRDYPIEQLGYMSNLLRGLPAGLNTTNITYAQQPGAAQQLLGTGLAGLGAYNMMR
jgi:hypothetical protein